METPPELTGSNLFLSGAGQRVYLDNETLNDTPAPVAASTVARLAPDKPRLSGMQGSFLDDLSAFETTPASAVHSHIPMNSLRNTSGEQSGSLGLPNRPPSDRNQVPNTFNRSSLGILPIDNMDELSSSLLHVGENLHGSTETLQIQRDQKGSDKNMMGEGVGTFTMEYESSEPSSGQNTRRVGVRGTSAHGAPGMEGTAHSKTAGSIPLAPQQEIQSTTLDREVVPGLRGSSTSLSSRGHQVQDEVGYDVCGGRDIVSNPLSRAAMLFGGQDADTSVHEVEINAEELEQFDDDFSDMGDMDHTVTEVASPEHKGGVDMTTTGGIQEGEALMKSVQPMNIFNDPHPFEIVGATNYPLETDEPGLDEPDTEGKTDEKGSNNDNWPDPKKMSFSLLKECPNFQRFMKSDCIDFLGSKSESSHPQHKSELGKRSEFLRTPGDPGYERETNQGEGQEADMSVLTVARSEFELDSVYLHGGHPQAGVEDSPDIDHRMYRSSNMFDNSPPESTYCPRREASQADRYDSSEIDTEDEVEAVRREMLETFNRQNESSQERPDLEGWNQSSEQDEIRQSAEGVVENSLPPGDGDGMDHSELNIPPSSSGQRSATTFQVLQKLGFNAAPEPDWPQSFQTESRLLPTGTEGGELTDSQEARKVRFADVRESRDRTVSGASAGDPERVEPSATGHTAQPQPKEFRESDKVSKVDPYLASRFLAPYNPSMAGSCLGMSQINDLSEGHGLEDSTFNLGDLVPGDSPPEADHIMKGHGYAGRQHAVGSDAGYKQETGGRGLRGSDKQPRQRVIGTAQSEKEKPEVDQVLSSSKKDTGEECLHHSSAPGEKTFLSDDSPVYINAQGEYVTDLAYQVPLDQLAQNPFDEASILQSAQAGDVSDMFGGGGGDVQGLELGSNDFMSGDQGLAMLDKDQHQFEKEHRFDHVEKVDSPPCHFHQTAGSSLGLPESWSLHSHLEDTTRPSWLSDMTTDAPFTRISIGAFMGARTEALGSLDGVASSRPAFGNKIVTPPSERKPVTLYEKTPPSTLKSIEEGVQRQQEDVRGAGVGSDSESDREDTHPEKSQNQSASDTQHYNHKSDTAREAIRPSQEVSKHQLESKPESAHSRASTPDMADMTGALDLSEITRLITAASSSAKPKELTDMILKLSHNKRVEKHGEEGVKTASLGGDKRVQGTGEKEDATRGKRGATDEEKKPIPQVVEARFNGKPVTSNQVTKQRSEFSTEIRGHHGDPNGKASGREASHATYGRVPADGISEKVPAAHSSMSNVPPAKSGKQQQQQQKLSKVEPPSGKARTSLEKQQPHKSGSAMQKHGSYPVEDTSRRSSNASGKSIQPPQHPRPSSSQGQVSRGDGNKQQQTKTRQSNIELNRSRIPVHHGTSPEAPARNRVTADRRSTGEGRKSGAKNEVESNKRVGKGVSSMSSQNKNKDRGGDRGTVRDKENNTAESSLKQPSTPKHLVLREKDFSSPGGYAGSAENNNMVDSLINTSDNEGDITWKSPRPSSVMSRSSRHDSMLDDESFCNSYQRPAELEGAQFKQPKTPPSSKSKQADHWVTNDNKKRQIPGIDNPGSGIRIQHANGDGSEGSGLKSRLSSTPVGGGDPFTFTMGTQDFSHIGGSPQTRRVQDFTDDSHDSTLTSDQDQGQRNDDNNVEFDNTQSTPKLGSQPSYQYNSAHSNNSVELRFQRNAVGTSAQSHTQQNDQYRHQQAGPEGNKALPTLLTDKPLSKTATPYMQSNEARNVSNYPSSQTWKSSTAPASGNKMSAGSYSLEPVYIKVPSELRIPEVCCVGLSTHCSLSLENPTQRWVQVHVKLVSLSMDGKAADMSRIMPFVMKEKVIVKPNSHEDIKVIFAPRQAGVYVGQLHVLASPVVSDQPLQPSKLPAMVTLQALAEKPQVQVVQVITPEKAQVLDFGALPWGCVKGMPIALINKSRATVPVRLVISSNKSQSYHANCFTFERYTTGDASLISNKNRPNIPAMSPCVVNYSLKGCGSDYHPNPMQVMVYFVSPSKQYEKGQSSSPEDFMARLDVEVDTPSSLMNLGSLILKSRSGSARLHTHTEMQEIHQRAELGRFHTQAVPLRNAGNIPIEVSLEVAQNTDCFSVFPTQLMIEPQGESHCTVKFQPKSRQPLTINSLLLMQVEPDGQSYELELIGDTIVAPEPTDSALTSAIQNSKGPPLYSNKRFLAWGGVPVSRAHQQTITLKNVAEHMLKLRLEIKASHQDFNIQSLYGKKERLTESKEVIIQSKEQYPVHVLFAPSQVTNREALLIIRDINAPAKKYTIPLSGYGGISKLVMEDVQKGQNSSFWVSVGTPESGRSLKSRFIIRNVGTRAAYVKCVAFADLRCKQSLTDSRVCIEPDEFCIKEQQSQEVTVILHTSDRDAAICEEKANILAAVVCFYGDEVSRQQLRRAVQKHGPVCLSKCPQKTPAQNFKFHLPYEGEDLITEECAKDTDNDVELFFTNMSKLTLAIVGEPHIPSPTPPSPPNPLPSSNHPSNPSLQLVPPASWERNEDLRTRPSKETDKSAYKLCGEDTKSQCSPPERLISSGQQNLPQSMDTQSLSALTGVSTTGSVSGGSLATGSAIVNGGTNEPGGVLEWGVIPPQLILPAPTKDSDPLIKQVQLLNVSERSMNFELSWPAHCITVNPEQGCIPPRQSVLVSVSCNAMLKSKGVQLPWSGNVHINCDGGCQILKIQIREGAIREDPVQKIASSYPSETGSEDNSQLVSIVTPSDNRAPLQRRGAPQWLGFKDSAIKAVTEAYFEIRNLCDQPVKWILSSFNPPYVKKGHAEKSVERVDYHVFWMLKKQGLLQPGEKNKVEVCFQPLGPGCFSQHWQVKAEAQVSAFTSTSISKIEFYGQCVVQNPVLVDATNFRGISWSKALTNLSKAKVVAQIPPSKYSKSDHTDDDGPIEVRCTKLSFPDTSPHENHMCKVELKNRDRVPHKVTIVEPHAPFNTRHSKISIKSRHYVRVPVQFSPQKAGHYQGELVLKVDTGNILTVPLLGTCVRH